MTARTHPVGRPGRPILVDLSIDFDFWVHEESDWDFGHSEHHPMFLTLAWQSRYHLPHLDLFYETNPEKWADFMPSRLVAKLAERGLPILGAPDAVLGVAESHKQAYHFFLEHGRRSPPDLVLNLDAHHDCFGKRSEQVLGCHNWLTFLARRWRRAELWQVYPKWKDAARDGTPNLLHRITLTHWEQFHFLRPAVVRHIFLCRSGAWVPPHLDHLFNRLVSILSTFRRRVILEPVPVRPFPTPEEAERVRRTHRRIIEQIVVSP